MINRFILSALCYLVVFPLSLSAEETRDLILVAGQSNAVGYDAYASELPPSDIDAQVKFWWRTGDPPPDRYDVTSGGKWSTLRPQPKGTPLDVNAPDVKEKLPRQYGNFLKPEGGFGPEIGLARHLRAKERDARPLAIVKAAFSGTGLIQDWNPEDPGPGGSCYRALVDETKAAASAAKADGVTLQLRALVWCQGESDANPQAAPQYEKNMAKLLTHLRKDLDAPKLLALIGVNTRYGNGKNPHTAVVVAQQKSLAEHDALTAYVDNEGAETLPPSHTHFTAKGTLEIGRRYADGLLALEAKRRAAANP